MASNVTHHGQRVQVHSFFICLGREHNLGHNPARTVFVMSKMEVEFKWLWVAGGLELTVVDLHLGVFSSAS